jgi:hypothetical protein
VTSAGWPGWKIFWLPVVALSPRKCCQRRLWSGKIRDGGVAVAAHREGLLVLGGFAFGGLAGARGGGRQRDLERFGVDHAQERQRRLHVLGGGPGQAVAALPR